MKGGRGGAAIQMPESFVRPAPTNLLEPKRFKKGRQFTRFEDWVFLHFY